MTDNQRRAHDELYRYREAQMDIRHYQQQIEVLEAKINRTTRSCDSIMQQTLINGKFVAVPVVVQTSAANAAENLLDSLMDARTDLMGKQAEAERLCMRLGNQISDWCDSKGARVLRNLFLYNKSLEQVAVMERYCYRHVKRIRNRALEQYGVNMSPHVPLIRDTMPL